MVTASAAAGHRRLQASGAESLRAAFDVARHISYAIDLDKSRNAEMETMLDFVSGGVVSMDSEGIVTRANGSAYQILNCPPQTLLGKRFADVFPALGKGVLDKALIEGDEAYTILTPRGGRERVVNVVPIRIDRRVTGAILTLQEGRRIIEIGSELRNEMYLRGYVARWRFDVLPSKSAAGRQMIQQAGFVAKYSAPVLLTGESGSGKEILAQCIHNASTTRGNAFLALDCRAYPPDRLDAMLFGAYAGRQESSACMAEIAQNGTLFLSHVESLSSELQYKVLRLIRGSYIRNGYNRPVESSVRVIAATDTNLIAKVEQRVFRDDLYYALGALEIELKPMRGRREDVLDWIDIFLKQWCARYDRVVHLTQGALDYLKKYDWPGSLNQMDSVCEQTALLSERRNIDESFLRHRIERLTPKVIPGTDHVIIYRDEKAAEIEKLLKEYHGNRQRVADALGISKTTLWRYMNKYGINRHTPETDEAVKKVPQK